MQTFGFLSNFSSSQKVTKGLQIFWYLYLVIALDGLGEKEPLTSLLLNLSPWLYTQSHETEKEKTLIFVMLNIFNNPIPHVPLAHKERPSSWIFKTLKQRFPKVGFHTVHSPFRKPNHEFQSKPSYNIQFLLWIMKWKLPAISLQCIKCICHLPLGIQHWQSTCHVTMSQEYEAQVSIFLLGHFVPPISAVLTCALGKRLYLFISEFSVQHPSIFIGHRSCHLRK